MEEKPRPQAPRLEQALLRRTSAHPDRRDRLVHLESTAKTERTAIPVTQERDHPPPAIPMSRDLPLLSMLLQLPSVHRVQLDHPDCLGTRVRRGHAERRAQKVRLDHQDAMGSKEKRGQKANPDCLGILASQERRELQERTTSAMPKDHLDLRERTAHPEWLARKELRESVAKTNSQAHREKLAHLVHPGRRAKRERQVRPDLVGDPVPMRSIVPALSAQLSLRVPGQGARRLLLPLPGVLERLCLLRLEVPLLRPQLQAVSMREEAQELLSQPEQLLQLVEERQDNTSRQRPEGSLPTASWLMLLLFGVVTSKRHFGQEMD